MSARGLVILICLQGAGKCSVHGAFFAGTNDCISKDWTTYRRVKVDRELYQKKEYACIIGRLLQSEMECPTSRADPCRENDR